MIMNIHDSKLYIKNTSNKEDLYTLLHSRESKSRSESVKLSLVEENRNTLYKVVQKY